MSATLTPEESWQRMPKPDRIKLMRKMGFGDVRAYAGYRWKDFASHTLVELSKLIEEQNK